ncbi:MAG TPA: phosphotransferase [Acidobacteriota bacterium]|nr:phosphotransferase [Acidobacteriota bacterium]
MPSETIQKALQACLGVRAEIVGHQVLAKASSFPIDTLQIQPASGERVEVVCKHLSRDRMLEGAAGAKPGFVVDPLREAAVYLDLLAPLQDELGTARFYGFEDGILFIERVRGAELYECGIESWQEAARWLRRFHEHFADNWSGSEHLEERLLSYDAAWFERWAERAGRFLEGESAAFESARAGFSKRVEEIESYPQGLVHGELYASNVLAEDRRIVPIDWEMAGRGPRWLDLAALTSGPWKADEITQIEGAYGLADADRPKVAFLRRALALQWLGWSPDWKPPKGQRQNWLEVFLSDG